MIIIWNLIKTILDNNKKTNCNWCKDIFKKSKLSDYDLCDNCESLQYNAQRGI